MTRTFVTSMEWSAPGRASTSAAHISILDSKSMGTLRHLRPQLPVRHRRDLSIPLIVAISGICPLLFHALRDGAPINCQRPPLLGIIRPRYISQGPVSYTHLTLPTIYS